MSRRLLLLGVGLAVSLGGCAASLGAPGQWVVAPSSAFTTVRAADPGLSGGTSGPAVVRRSVADRRQYFDQRKQRYYFYDPARRAYFWEDGSPKI